MVRGMLRWFRHLYPKAFQWPGKFADLDLDLVTNLKSYVATDAGRIGVKEFAGHQRVIIVVHEHSQLVKLPVRGRPFGKE
ncbi:hypothetical protein EVAR_5797_1 [Eumeta japonica]|uniref:Uncharacterized protein n=1 Tax=Eumeta variegata TaxID=151549 RepID=A0A4C1T7V6_EUMVA|nr:hypothetical protein EVAR_5797_1 [Eumeta japonica]